MLLDDSTYSSDPLSGLEWHKRTIQYPKSKSAFRVVCRIRISARFSCVQHCHYQNYRLPFGWLVRDGTPHDARSQHFVAGRQHSDYPDMQHSSSYAIGERQQ